MAGVTVPHLCNDAGVDRIRVGARELKCMGARPPFDHPHVYLDMGGDGEIICPYCSTVYTYDGGLEAGVSIPGDCVYHEAATGA